MDRQELISKYVFICRTSRHVQSNIRLRSRRCVLCTRKKRRDIKVQTNKTGLHGCVFPEKHRERVDESNKEQKAGHQHAETTAENRGNCSTQEHERACRARKLCHNTGAPTTKNFKLLLDGNMTRNCPAMADDVKTAEGTWGPDVSHLKASATRPRPDPVRMD